MHFKKAGDIEQGHAHQFDHQTLLSRGSVKITLEGVENVYHAPHIIFIRKDHRHELVALEDDTLCYCIHALRDGNDVCDIIAPDAIPQGAGSEMAFTVAKSLLNEPAYSS
jgi:quercetin dioxygenase-like cupin family protein